MNSTVANWDTHLHMSFNRLRASAGPSFSNAHIRESLVVIGLIVVGLLCFLALGQFILRVRRVYRETEPKIRRRSRSNPFSSYQMLLTTDRHVSPCKLSQFSCLPKLQCIHPSTVGTRYSTSNYPHYERINETKTNGTCRVLIPSVPLCVRVQTV